MEPTECVDLEDAAEREHWWAAILNDGPPA